MSNKNDDDGEFRGTTKQALSNLEKEVTGLQDKVDNLSTRTTIIIVILAALFAERVNEFVGIAMAGR